MPLGVAVSLLLWACFAVAVCVVWVFSRRGVIWRWLIRLCARMYLALSGQAVKATDNLAQQWSDAISEVKSTKEGEDA